MLKEKEVVSFVKRDISVLIAISVVRNNVKAAVKCIVENVNNVQTGNGGKIVKMIFQKNAQTSNALEKIKNKKHSH